jgi:hypothetical protein
LYLISGRVSRVKDSTPRVSTFSVQMKLAISLTVKFRPEVYQLLDPFRTFSHNELNDLAFA